MHKICCRAAKPLREAQGEIHVGQTRGAQVGQPARGAPELGGQRGPGEFAPPPLIIHGRVKLGKVPSQANVGADGGQAGVSVPRFTVRTSAPGHTAWSFSAALNSLACSVNSSARAGHPRPSSRRRASSSATKASPLNMGTTAIRELKHAVPLPDTGYPR